jgi:diacylglycerol kinase (ATP)
MTGSDTPRTLVVVNPESAAGAARRQWPQLGRLLEGRYGRFESRFTARPGDATELTRRGLREGFEVVIAVGGDGTLNEVANGFFEPAKPGEPLVAVREDAALGLFPYGTGGDFRKTMKIPKKPSEAVRALRFSQKRFIDVGRLDLVGNDGQRVSRVFVNIASFGLSGKVDELVERGPKWLGGKLSFFLASARAISAYTPQEVALTLDGRPLYEGPVYFVAVANGQYFGGGMWVAPEAAPDDGLFDVVVVRGMPKARWFLQGSKIYSGAHLKMPEVSVHRGKKLLAEPKTREPVRLDVDGEQPGSLTSTFEIFPGALPFLAPTEP